MRSWRRFGLLGALSSALVMSGLLLGHAPTHGAAPNDTDGDGLRNHWEVRWSETDPTLADSNGDGLIDANEDPDGDGLGNLGEQAFHTDPLVADTDDDGTPDGADDTDADGVADGAEQDRRPVPADLKPSLAKAADDTPVSYRNGCHTLRRRSAIHPCVYGDAAGSTSVAIYGDSHALQWVPALVAAAKVEHWKVIVITKSGCPSVEIRYRSGTPADDVEPCKQWQANAIAWLNQNPPDLVILSNRHGSEAEDADGNPIPFEPAWAAGLARTLRKLPHSGQRLILGDTPHPKTDVPQCLMAHLKHQSICETTRAEGEDPAHDVNEQTTAESHHASYVSLNAIVCSYDPCPVVAGNILMWRDESHLTATWSRRLWPTMDQVVTNALAPPESSR